PRRRERASQPSSAAERPQPQRGAVSTPTLVGRTECSRTTGRIMGLTHAVEKGTWGKRNEQSDTILRPERCLPSGAVRALPEGSGVGQCRCEGVLPILGAGCRGPAPHGPGATHG